MTDLEERVNSVEDTFYWFEFWRFYIWLKIDRALKIAVFGYGFLGIGEVQYSLDF